MLTEGQILEGKYEVCRALARGGTGEVYLGRNLRLGKEVAIKVLHPELARERSVADRFEQEARLAARIRSEHIADVYDLGDLPTGERFMVMELLDGETLADRLERTRSIGERALAEIAIQILDALASAHERGVIHRDLKPENVFLTRRDHHDVVKVVDFGISKLATEAERRPITLPGAILGTPLYMSPEQARGKELDHRTDLYSLGVILYEAALGEPPFASENVNDLLFRVALDNVTPLELRLPSVSLELAAIVKRAMARSPFDRFQTALEMRDAVIEWQSSLGPTTRGSTPSFVDDLRVTTPTPRPWALTQPDEELDVDVESLVPKPRRVGRFVAFATVCALVALGVTHPQRVRSMSSQVAARTAPLFKGAEPPRAPAMVEAKPVVQAPKPAPTVEAPNTAAAEEAPKRVEPAPAPLRSIATSKPAVARAPAKPPKPKAGETGEVEAAPEEDPSPRGGEKP